MKIERARESWISALGQSGCRTDLGEFQNPRILWDRVLTAPYVKVGLEVLKDEGILREDFPEVSAIVGFGGQGHKDLWSHVKQVVLQTPPETHLRWAALFHDVGKVKCFRRGEDDGKISFHGHEIVSAHLWQKAMNRTGWFPGFFGDRIKFLVEHLGHVESYEPSWTDSAVRRVVRDMGKHFPDLVALSRADMTTADEKKFSRNQRRIDELVARVEKLALEAKKPKPRKGLGIELANALDLKPGPALGKAMKAIQDAIVLGTLRSEAPVEEYVRWLAARPG